jgi:hypothetical protein
MNLMDFRNEVGRPEYRGTFRQEWTSGATASHLIMAYASSGSRHAQVRICSLLNGSIPASLANPKAATCASNRRLSFTYASTGQTQFFQRTRFVGPSRNFKMSQY